MKAKTQYGEFTVVGYESTTIHYPIRTRPESGFAYVQQAGNEIGAIPKQRILNWDQLPYMVELHPKLVIQRAKCPDFKKQQ